MKANLNDKYRRAAEEFARRVVSALGDQIDSIVLYGSVARGEAWAESDIDILVISSNIETTRDTVSDIRSDLTEESDYSFLMSLTQRSRDAFHELVDVGSPFVAEMLGDGVVLYDNGTFARARQEGARVG